MAGATMQIDLAQLVPAAVMAPLTWFYHSLDGELLGLLYMVGVCADHRHRRYNSYLYSYLSCLVFSCGGSSAVALITGRPMSLLSADQYIMSSFMIWFLMFYTPVGLIFRFRFARVLLSLVLSVGWGRTISWGVSVAEQVYPNSRFSWIALGTMSGAGGGLIEVLDQKIWGEPKSWSVLGFKTASFVACWFSLLTNPCSPGSNPHLCNIMSEDHAMIVTGLMLTLFSLSASLFDRPIDYWYPVERIFDLLTGVFGEFEVISLPSSSHKHSDTAQDSDTDSEEDDEPVAKKQQPSTKHRPAKKPKTQ